MNQIVSIYLDLVRFLAATLVFIAHANYDRFTSGWLDDLSGYGNDAVMVFFVLSGYVIAYVTDKREDNYKAYFLARFSRLWSVVVPALALTVVLDYVGSRVDYSIYAGWWFRSDDPIWRLLTNLFFVNELWFSSVRPFSNGPFWSIGYEFWYYVAWAALAFGKSIWRWIIFALAALVMGPKILLLLPVWLFGVFAYEKSKTFEPSPFLGWILIVGSILFYGAYQHFEIEGYLRSETLRVLGPELVKDLSFSDRFVSDYLVGILVAAHFVGIILASNQLGFLLRHIKRPIQFLAGYTFSIYLLHYPLMHFFAAVIKNDPDNWFHQMIILVCTIASILLIGTFTEKKKSTVRRILDRGTRAIAAYFAKSISGERSS